MKLGKISLGRPASGFFRAYLWLLPFLLFGSALGQDAKVILDRSAELLRAARDLQVDYRIKKEVPDWVGVRMVGSLSLASNNRCYLTNGGVFTVYDGAMECITDGTNYLSVGGRNFQWEHDNLRTNLNEFTARHFLYSGITPLIAAQIAFYSAVDPTTNQLALATFPFPFLASAVIVSNITRQSDTILEGKAALKFSWTSQGFNGKSAITELWLDKTSMLPLRRVVSETDNKPVEETYSFRVNEALPPSSFDPWNVIRRRKLEQAIANTETPDALLLKACRRIDIKLAAKSLAEGASPNAKTSMTDMPPSFTALTFAAKAGDLGLVKLLVEHGAEINAGGRSGSRPLLFACMEGKAETVSYLIEHGASLSNATASLCWAAWRGHSNVVKLLAEKGVPVDQSAGELGTPLQKAIEGGFVDIARLLVKSGARINRTNEGGATHLQTAVRWGNLETVKFLLDAGAEVNVRDGYGFTPLMYAASANKPEAAGLLLDKGADAQVKNDRGLTAMDMAARNRRNNQVTDLFVSRGLMKPPASK